MGSPKKVVIWLVEDDPMIRESFFLLFNQSKYFICSTFRHGEAYLNALKISQPTVVLMDIGLPEVSGIELLRKTKIKFPRIEVIMLTVHSDNQYVFDALCAGASGYLLKDMKPELILRSIQDVLSGGAPMSSSIARMVVKSFRQQRFDQLSTREQEVLHLLSKGLSYKLIGDSLDIRIDTVRTHIRSIYKKLNVNSSLEAVTLALKGTKRD